MKATIAGIRYDTSKAVFVGTGTNIGAHRWSEWTATLFASPHGTHWFLAGEGGRMTIFAAKGPHGLEYGERIIPLSLLDAGQFAEAYLGRGSPAVEALWERIAQRHKPFAEATA